MKVITNYQVSLLLVLIEVFVWSYKRKKPSLHPTPVAEHLEKI